jgi:hypothetical protein
MKVIAIDCGIHNGLAVFCTDKQEFETVRTYQLWELFVILDYVCKMNEGNYSMYVENPNTYVPFGNAKKQNAKRQGAGAVKQTYKHITEFLESKGFDYKAVTVRRNLKRIYKFKGSKPSALEFETITGYIGRTNEHNRDAGIIAWHYSNNKFIIKIIQK